MRITGSRLFSVAVTAAIIGLTLAPGTPARGTPAPAARTPARTPAPNWPQPRYDAAGTGYNPQQTQLGDYAKMAGKALNRTDHARIDLALRAEILRTGPCVGQIEAVGDLFRSDAVDGDFAPRAELAQDHER